MQISFVKFSIVFLKMMMMAVLDYILINKKVLKELGFESCTCLVMSLLCDMFRSLMWVHPQTTLYLIFFSKTTTPIHRYLLHIHNTHTTLAYVLHKVSYVWGSNVIEQRNPSNEIAYSIIRHNTRVKFQIKFIFYFHAIF